MKTMAVTHATTIMPCHRRNTRHAGMLWPLQVIRPIAKQLNLEANDKNLYYRISKLIFHRSKIG